MRKLGSFLMALLLLLTAAGFAMAESFIPGTYSAAKNGFGGEIFVTLTVDETAITAVEIKGDSETANIGSRAVEELDDAILAAQNAEVDGISGATVTSDAIKAAVAECIAQARGEEKQIAPVVMKPGRYVEYVESFNQGDGLTVTVTVTEDRIQAIEVDMEHTSDMYIILKSAVDNLIPRMIEHQSVTVDAVTGATVSSNSIKRATKFALQDALAAGGSDASAIENFYVDFPQSDAVVELETEVLVIGMGGAGTVAAVSAAEGGAQVLAIDKAARYGGTTTLTCDIMAVNPPRMMELYNEGNAFVNEQELYEDWITYCEGDAKEELVQFMIDKSGEMLDWLVFDQGAQVSCPVVSWLSPDNRFAVAASWLPPMWNNTKYLMGYFDAMIEKYTANGGQYMLETEGYDLIYDEATNTVTGAKARNVVDGTEYIIKADAVILATGGYMGSEELQLQMLQNTYYPLNGVWKHYGTKQNDGKMWKAALAIGAGTYNTSMPPEVHSCSTASWLTEFPRHYIEGQNSMVADRPAFWTEGDLPMYLGWCSDSLAVAPTGKRFASETGVALLDPWLPGPEFFSIWGEDQIRKIEAEGFDALNGTIFFGSLTTMPMGVPVPNVDAVLEAAVEAGIMVKADTIEGLAEQLGIDPTALAETVAAYNSYCETGVDEEFGKPAQFLDPVTGESYYAVKMYSYAYGSCGAIDINEKFQVLKNDGETAIGGLYAVGTDSMGVLFSDKKPYVTYGGANNSWSLTSGRYCGLQVAAELAE